MASNKLPFSHRPNFRMMVLAAVVLFLVGYPAYLYVDAAVTGGAKDLGSAWAVDLKALGNFPFDDENGTVNDIPAKWRNLDGKKVILEGFMSPLGHSADGEVSQFDFVYNVTKCCFNGPPKVQERVSAHTTMPVPFENAMIRCIGTLHVHVHKNDVGKVDGVYDMDLDKVEQL